MNAANVSRELVVNETNGDTFIVIRTPDGYQLYEVAELLDRGVFKRKWQAVRAAHGDVS
jgi:hypothetical protein